MENVKHKEIFERRRLRLQELVAKHGSQKALSDAVGIDSTVISRMLYPEGKKNKRNIGELSARSIEQELNLPSGWMDSFDIENVSNDEGLVALNPRQKILLELFGELPDSEADELLEALKEKKRHYDELYEELNRKRQGKVS